MNLIVGMTGAAIGVCLMAALHYFRPRRACERRQVSADSPHGTLTILQSPSQQGLLTALQKFQCHPGKKYYIFINHPAPPAAKPFID